MQYIVYNAGELAADALVGALHDKQAGKSFPW